jgi:6-phosphofructokinase 1
LKAVTIVEIMGRNSGWLTAAAALAKGDDCNGADMIFLPEIPFTMENFFQKIEQRLQVKGNLVIAVSEGVKLPDGRYVCELASCGQGEDVFGHKQLTGTALFLADECAKRFGVKTRAIELSTPQRAASHIASLTDIDESCRVGGAAVTAAMNGQSGVASVFVRTSDKPYCCETGVVDIHEIANLEKTVPVEWINEDGTDLTDEYLTYARPLIQGELTPYFVDGLPQHLVLK